MIMGLLSKSDHSKKESEARSNPKFTTTPPSTVDRSSSMASTEDSPPPYKFSSSTSTLPSGVDQSSSTASPKVSPPSYRSFPSTSTLPQAPPPRSGSGSNSRWPASPHAGDYQARIAKLEEDSKAHPHKKNWFKEKLNLADPTEREYYERRFLASGDGSDYEQNARIAMLGAGGLI
jgi:hypothetical protein